MQIKTSAGSEKKDSRVAVQVWSVGTLTYTTTGLVVLFLWLLWGDFAWSTKERSVGTVVQLVFQQYKISDTLTGLVLGTLPAAISLFVAPIISYKSDRCRSPWGRRIPFLLLTTPFVTFSMIGLAMTTVAGRYVHALLGGFSPGAHAVTLAGFIFFWIAFELATIAANSVFGALVNDVVPHHFLGRFFGLFRAVSLTVGVIFNFFVLKWAEANHALFFVAIGVLYGVALTLMCFNVKEGKYPDPEESGGDEPEPLLAMITYFKMCFGHSFYIWYYAFCAVTGMAFSPVNGFIIYFAKSVNMDTGLYGKYTALTFLISLVLSYPVGALVDRIHPLRVGLGALAIYTAATLWGGLYARDVQTFGIAFVLHVVLSGTYFTSTAALGQMLLPKDRFAQFASAGGVVACLSGMLVGPAVGIFLDHANHEYRYTFLITSGLSFVGLMLGLVLYRKMKSLGGIVNYIAP